ncbi:MAG: hypothetical protein PVG65_04585 [Candidatus Thorarchaeota archaeon]|jgi:hypothetical protein
MNEYLVVLTRSVFVNAENKDEARNKAFDLFNEDMSNDEVTVDLQEEGVE